jgi:hypothetical protein
MNSRASSTAPAFLCASLLLLASPFFVHADSEKDSSGAMRSTSLEDRGKHLRADVVAKYRELKAAGALEGKEAMKGVDITPVILRYIPVGASFHDAEAILRAGGSKLKAEPKPSDSGDVVARLDLPAPTLGFVGVKCVVSLTPEALGDYSTVGKVVGGIILLYP